MGLPNCDVEDPAKGVAKATILRRYEATSYDRDMERYLDSLDPRFVARMEGRIREAVAAVLRTKSHCRILIPAVGTGRALRLLPKADPQRLQIECIDFNPKMTSGIAPSTLGSHVRIQMMDLMEAGDRYQPNSFDVIIWEFSGCLVPDPVEAWKIMIELCAPGGYIVYNDYVAAASGPILRAQLDLRDPARSVGMRWFRVEELPSYVDVRDLRLIETNGILSTLNVDEFEADHSIVWDPAYSVQNILTSSWLERQLTLTSNEILISDSMQSNISIVYCKK